MMKESFMSEKKSKCCNADIRFKSRTYIHYIKNIVVGHDVCVKCGEACSVWGEQEQLNE